MFQVGTKSLLGLLVLYLVHVPAIAQQTLDQNTIIYETVDSPTSQLPSNQLPPPRFRQLRVGATQNFSKNVWIDKIAVLRATAVSEATFSSITNKYRGRALDAGDFQNIANEITREYQQRGYFLSRARIAPQPLSAGQLVVSISEGYVEKIVINEDDNHELQPYFSEFLSTRPANLKTLQDALAEVESTKGISLIEPRIIENELIKEAFTVAFKTEDRKAHVQVNFFNKGVRRGESTRAIINARIKSVFRLGDQLSVAFLTKPTALSELAYVVSNYNLPVNQRGDRLFVETTLSKSRPKSALPDRDLKGELYSAAIGYSIPVILNARRRLVTSAKFEWTDAQEQEDGEILFNDKLRLIRLSANFVSAFSKKSQFSVQSELTAGLDGFNASTLESTLLSRPDGDGQFSKVRLDAYLRHFIKDNVSLTFGFNGQYADSPLLFTEEYSFGGGSFGRGYDFGEILGDSGVAAFMEAGVHQEADGIINKWQIYGFADVGTVWNQGQGLNADGDPLFSAGLGLRVNINEKLRINYEAAHPLSDAPYTLDDRTTRHRFQVTASN